MRWRTSVIVLLLCRTLTANAQVVVEVERLGTGAGPDALAQALHAPHVTVPPRLTPWVLSSDATIDSNLVVIGCDAVIEGHVRGDVVIVAGDLYMHPGGKIDGRVIAIDGGVYESSLATLTGGFTVFRDFTYDIAATPTGVSLTFRSLARDTESSGLPSLFGIHIPTYDRSNGLSVGVGPSVELQQGRIQIGSRLTYRSQLGRLDPSVSATVHVNPQTRVDASVGRGTFTNDSWIQPDILNSVDYLSIGDDTRNYFRATRAEGRIARQWSSRTTTIEPYVGARWETDRSVRPASSPSGGPWTFFNRHGRDDVLRPNPTIDPGTIASFLAGAEVRWASQGITARAKIDEEIGRFSRADGADTTSLGSFAQTTFDGTIQFPTFGTQSIHLRGHAVYSATEPTPRQRWAYVGGLGSIPTIELLARGGDQLIYFDGRYLVPLAGVRLPFGASPIVMLREVLAGASVGTGPSLAQATGVRIALSALYAELLEDPAARKAHFSVGLSLSR